MQKVGRLELTWVGKYEEDRFEPRILIEDKEKSYGDASSDNMLIHGDNLLALKALERDYTGKIRCIYIDPPYNTGNAFEHYDDDLEHSIWLNMLYKRIRILHSLLAENGTLWISIDSTEGHYLKVMCDEIFGRSNFVSDITYEKSNVTGLGQGGAIFNTGEKILVYKKNILELNEVLASEKLSKKTMQRYRKYIQSEGTKELVEEFESASNGLPVRIYKHTDYVIGDISLKQFESRESEIRAQYYEFFDTIYRTYVVQQENEFQNSLMSRMENNSLYSVEYTPSRGRNGGKETTLFYHNGELCAWLKDTAFLEGRDVVKTTKLSNVWKNDDIPKADLGNEGGVAFPRSKKPEKLIERILLMATNEGDLVLDSFLGSGTTAAVAHKMSRKYIGIELGDHCYSLCKKRLDIPSQRGASNVYFAVSRSAISIPPWINPLYNLIDEHLRDIELAKQLMGDEGITKIYEMYFSAYTRNEFDEALERRMSNIKEFTEIKQMEYNAITHHNDPAYESNKKHFKAEEDALPGYLQKYFSRIIRVTRLREVRVLLGFTRVEAPDPDADEQPNVVALSKGKQERWLPAAEVNGEGIFIEFNKDTLAAWLNSPAVKGLSQKYSDSYREFCESKGWTITVVRNAVYVLMHTFAHLMIKQMSMSSGYSSSAIRERIYFGDKMSGILLYTGSSDKEGSLGGLVELGNIDQMTNLMRDAFQEALVCTNDPECMSNLPAGKNSNGAACHSCCMISETACENGNRMLDRGLVVPIPEREECSYFKELVSELCQVEI